MTAYLDTAAIVISIALVFIGTGWWSGRRISLDKESQ